MMMKSVHFVLVSEGNAYTKVKKLMSTPQKVKAITNMSPYGQTSRLESFHRIILSYAPKHLSFGFDGSTAR